MKYYEIRTTMLLKKDICYKDVGYVLSKHINFCMLNSEYLKKLHSDNKPKLYCFDYLYPLEEDKTYKNQKVYVFRIRTPVENVAKELRRVLSFYKSSEMNSLGCDLTSKYFSGAEEIYTITPAITTVENKNWIVGDSFDLLWERLDKNLQKKYNLFFEKEIVDRSSAIELLEIKNKKSIVMNLKNGKVFGNKFSITFKPDEYSQKLAYIALTCGVLEKTSSIGAGFCKIGKKGAKI